MELMKDRMKTWRRYINGCLPLNSEKTEYMIIGSKQRLANVINDPQIELGEATIKRGNIQNIRCSN
jgi:hypothetical protein